MVAVCVRDSFQVLLFMEGGVVKNDGRIGPQFLAQQVAGLVID